MRTNFDAGIEITLPLKIVAEIAPPLLQQVLVHGSFRINGQNGVKFSFAKMRSDDFDADAWTRVHFIFQRHDV